MLIVDAFLLSCLINTEDDYALSSSVALAVFEKLPGLAAVVFPSIYYIVICLSEP